MAKKKPLKMDVSAEDLGVLKRLFRRTWQIVGNDVLSAIGESSCSWEEAFQACADADRLRTYAPEASVQERAVVEKFYAAGYDEMERVFIFMFGKGPWG
jgi:hypothetical protein